MIIIKSENELALMREAGKVNGEILRKIADLIRPGLRTIAIDDFVAATVEHYGMRAAEKGYCGYPAHVCVSINEEVVHGIPDKRRILRSGDIVSVDLVVEYKGYMADAARTYAVGDVSPEAARLIETAERAFGAGIRYARVGCRLYDISHAIQTVTEEAGFHIITDYEGHGIGREMHEDPMVPNMGRAGKGPRLLPGMTLAIEPMICQGDGDTDVLLDEWTAVTVDGGLAAHYENTVVITEGEPEVLTL